MASLYPNTADCQTFKAFSGSEATLPCLYSNNSTDPINKGLQADYDPSKDRSINTLKAGTNRLSTQHKKSASALAWNVQALAEKHGIERIGFLTLTFADHVLEYREAQKRFNSLAKNVLRVRYSDYIRVLERQKSGRIHYHLLVVLPEDIRTGFDFDAISNHDYSSANNYLRKEWAFWRFNAKKYRFGRTELMPVRSTHEGIARYVGKYISKHIEQRQQNDKGARLVEYSRGARIATTKYNFVSDNSRLWRKKVAHFCKIFGETIGEELNSLDDLKTHLGARWAYEFRDIILSIPEEDLPQYKPLPQELAPAIEAKPQEKKTMKFTDALPQQQLLLAELWADLHDSDACAYIRELSGEQKLELLLQDEAIINGRLDIEISSHYRKDGIPYVLDLSCYIETA